MAKVHVEELADGGYKRTVSIDSQEIKDMKAEADGITAAINADPELRDHHQLRLVAIDSMEGVSCTQPTTEEADGMLWGHQDFLTSLIEFYESNTGAKHMDI